MNAPHQVPTPDTQGRTLRKNVPLYGGREYGDFVDEPDESGSIAVRLRVTTQTPVERLGRERPDEFPHRYINAANKFREHFEMAHLGPTFAGLDPDGVMGLHRQPEPEITDAELYHREEVNKAFAAVGQIGGSLLWYVVGCGEDLETWCWRISQSYKNHAWGGRCGLAGHVSVARENLRRALDVLADAWGY